MTLCKHFIVSPSSFSWWAAWLNEDPKKLVVATSRWYTPERAKAIASPEKADGDYINDIIPESWIKA